MSYPVLTVKILFTVLTFTLESTVPQIPALVLTAVRSHPRSVDLWLSQPSWNSNQMPSKSHKFNLGVLYF